MGKLLRAPFREDGSLLSYGDGDVNSDGWDEYGTTYTRREDGTYEFHREVTGHVTMKVVQPFIASLRPVREERGRSAARIIWEDSEGASFPMFQVDIVDTLQRVTISEGWTHEVTWTVKKRGANFGIVLAGDQAMI